MSKQFFSEHDKVYCPSQGTKIFTLYSGGGTHPQPLMLYDGDIALGVFNANGCDGAVDVPKLFHATPETKEKLEDLYGVEFEKPPTPPSSREIIRAMLERGDKNVLCWVGNTRKEVESGYLWKFITEYNENSDYPYVSEGRGSVGSWVFAIPLDHRTEQPITELPE